MKIRRRPVRCRKPPHGIPPVDEVDRRLIVATQAGLPLVPQPYHALAAQLGLAPEEVMARLQRMQAAGVIRRIGAVPNHYALGYRGNGMSVWDVPDDRVRTLGRAIGELDFVSHCYHRPRAAARLAVQPVRHGARARPRRGRRQGAANRRAPRRCRSRLRGALQYAHLEKKPACELSRIYRIKANFFFFMFRISQYMQEIKSPTPLGRNAAARAGGDLEPHPALQPHLQALLFDLGRQGFSRRAFDRGGLQGHGRSQGLRRAGADSLGR